MSDNMPGTVSVNAPAAVQYQQSDLFKTVNLAASRADRAATAQALATPHTLEQANGTASGLDEGARPPLPTPFAQAHHPGSAASVCGTASLPGQPLANGDLKPVRCTEHEETIASLSAKVQPPRLLWHGCAAAAIAGMLSTADAGALCAA